jgi:hypothetical protein
MGPKNVRLSRSLKIATHLNHNSISSMKRLTSLLLCVFTFSVSAYGQSLVQPNAKVKKLGDGNEVYRGPSLVTR